MRLEVNKMGGEKPQTDNLIEKVFGTSGILAQFQENYEYREGQIKMAEAIERAFNEKKHLIVEAGTGTGKTLAYLIPAIAESIRKKKRIIISTGTKNLQEQLMEKDIPFLQKVVPTKFSAAYMKGRSNYACLYRLHKNGDQPVLDGMRSDRSFSACSRMVARYKNRRPRRAYLSARKSFILEPDKRQKRDLHRPKMS